MTDVGKITQYYDQNASEEYLRLAKTPFHEAEFVLTVDLLNEYIPDKSDVLDIGSGPGRYSEYLIKTKSCNVGLVDISAQSLQDFRERMNGSYFSRIMFTQASSATSLPYVQDVSFDHVLLMGPLYHLQAAEERKQAIAEAKRLLKPGGYIFASFLSPYLLLPRFLDEAFLLIENRELVHNIVANGSIESSLVSGFVDHFRCWPGQAREMMEGEGFRTIRMRNMEGVGTFFRERQMEVLTNGAKKEAWFDILRMTCENPDLLGATIHFLYVGRK